MNRYDCKFERDDVFHKFLICYILSPSQIIFRLLLIIISISVCRSNNESFLVENHISMQGENYKLIWCMKCKINHSLLCGTQWTHQPPTQLTFHIKAREEKMLPLSSVACKHNKYGWGLCKGRKVIRYMNKKLRGS